MMRVNRALTTTTRRLLDDLTMEALVLQGNYRG